MTRLRWRKPALLSSVVFLGLALLFLAAARWQWQRAEFKLERAADFAQSLREPAQRSLADALHAPDPRGFEQVQVEGELDLDRAVLLDNQIRDGQYGVEVFAPLRDRSGAVVLAGLGWIAADRSRQQAPRLPPVTRHIASVALLTSPPSAGLQLGAAAAEEATFPLLSTRIDPQALRGVLGLPGLAGQVVLLPPDAASGFVRAWHLTGLSADKHRGYALQWSSFAIGTLVFYVLWHRPRKGSSA